MCAHSKINQVNAFIMQRHAKTPTDFEAAFIIITLLLFELAILQKLTD